MNEISHIPVDQEQEFFLSASSYSGIDVLQKNILIIISAYCVLNNYLFSVNPNNIQIIDPKNRFNWAFNYHKEFGEIKAWIRQELIENEETRFSYEPNHKLLTLSYFNIFFGKIYLSEEENDMIYENVKHFYKRKGKVMPAAKFYACGDIFRKYARYYAEKLSIEIKEFFL